MEGTDFDRRNKRKVVGSKEHLWASCEICDGKMGLSLVN